MLLLALAASATALAASHAPRAACPPERPRPVAADAKSRPHTLNREPRADMHLPVVRTIDGCAKPVILVRDVERNLTRKSR